MKAWKGALIGGIVGFVVFITINIVFIIKPQIGFSFLKPAYYIFRTLLGGVFYAKIFGSEWREVLSLTVIYSLIFGMVIYLIIRKRK